MSTHGPVEAKQVAMMNALAHSLDEMFNPQLADDEPRTIGFVLLAFDFGEAHPRSRMNYISNAPRPDMIVALKELVANFEGRMMPETKGQ